MILRKLVAIAFALSVTAAPALAQGTAAADKNAHHYSGGPKTEVPHAMKHPTSAEKSKKTKATNSGGHHYSGGPKTEPHHMGEKK